MISNDEREFQSREDILREYEAARLRLAFFDLQEDRINQLETGCEDNEELDRLVKEAEPAAMALIRREVRRKHVHRFTKRALPVVGYAAKVAATFIAIFTIGISTAFALIPEFQVKVLEMFIRLTDQYAEIGLKEAGSIQVPSDWPGEYFPAYIPDGFTICKIDGGITGASFVEYKNDIDTFLVFHEGDIDGRGNIDVEDAMVTDVTVHDNPGLASVKNGRTIIAWTESNKFFYVTLDGDLDMALKIARSVIKIN